MNISKLNDEFNNILEKTLTKKNDIYFLWKYLSDKTYFFDYIINNDIINLKKILKNIFIKELDFNEILFYEGDISDNFYIILKGEVGIYKKIGKILDLNNLKLDNESNYKKLIIKQFSEQFFNKFIKNDKLFDEKLQNFKINKISSIQPGSYFGEKGNVNNQKRNATIITEIYKGNIEIENDTVQNIDEYLIYKELLSNKYKNKVLFGCLNKIFFNKFIKEKFITEKNIKLYWLKNIFKNNILEEDFHKILYYLKKTEIKNNKYLFKKGDKLNKIYLIFKGKIKLLDNLIINKIKEDENYVNYNKNYLKYLKLKLKKDYYLNNKILQNTVRTCKDNDFIGLYELAKGKKHYLFDAIIESNNIVIYEITLENITILSNCNFKFKDILIQHLINFDYYDELKIKLKNQWRKNLKTINYHKSPNPLNLLSVNKKNNIKELLIKHKNNLNKYKDMYNVAKIISNRYNKSNNTYIYENNYKNSNNISKISSNKNRKINKSIDWNKNKAKNFLNIIKSNFSFTKNNIIKKSNKIILKSNPKKIRKIKKLCFKRHNINEILKK